MVLADFRPQILTLAALGLAFLLGTLIGLERQWRQRSARLASGQRRWLRRVLLP